MPRGLRIQIIDPGPPGPSCFVMRSREDYFGPGNVWDSCGLICLYFHCKVSLVIIFLSKIGYKNKTETWLYVSVDDGDMKMDMRLIFQSPVNNGLQE